MFLVQLNQILSSPQLLICLLFWKSWPTKFIPLTDREELKIVLSSTLIYFLNHKHYEATVEGQDGRDKKCFPHFIKIYLEYVGNSLILYCFPAMCGTIV